MNILMVSLKILSIGWVEMIQLGVVPVRQRIWVQVPVVNLCFYFPYFVESFFTIFYFIGSKECVP